MNNYRFALLVAALFTFCAVLEGCGGSGGANPSVALPQNPPAPPAGSPSFTYVLGTAHVQGLVSSGPQPSSVIANSPFDLTFFGGRLLAHTVSHDVNINCPASCWGTAARGTATTFLRNLEQSNIIHVVDPYVAATANDRYGVAVDTNLKITLPHIVMLPALITAVHTAAVTAKATGYGNVLHLFFPKGTDVCLSSTVCYSPDNPATFVFCALHDSITFSDVGHVLFTVEPYQLVAGCFVPTAVPHGVIDATSSTLSHELIETITDPDPGTGWFNTQLGFEIGDECIGFRYNDNLFGSFYDIQSEYSNSQHACVNGV